MSDVDFAFAWEGASEAVGPFRHLQVVDFRGSEGISSLYRYEVTLLAREPAPEVDPEELIQARATLRLATLADPAYRVVHGIITEAEELGATQSGMLYRVVLSPPLVRAAHRTRCRIFLEKTTRQILDAVLQGDPSLTRDDGATAEPDGGDMTSFTPARERYAFRVAHSERIDDAATRPYCVQYNESDLAFVARLLEEEGISYHFEHGEGVCLLVLADADGGRARLDPFAPLGPGLSSREIASVKLGARLRPRKVSLLDYNWKKPALDMAVATSDEASGEDLVDHEYPGRYPDAPDQGKPLAQAKLDRLAVEARYAVGEGAVRLLSAGSIFMLEHPTPRYEGEYLVTRLEVRGEQQGVLPPGGGGAPAQGVPFAVRFECARRGKNGSAAESRFRPARTSPKPRVHGTQTAFVTAEPSAAGAEIHVGGPPGAEIGCVRVKFHWDQDAERLAREPSSCWVRVNQVFAGVGEGAVFHPRVGVEVIVDFEEGDPDRPIVVGRVYNGQNRPPGGSPTVSTFKTMTSPGGGSFNELTFDDTAGSQQIKMHTPMNWNSEVGNDRNEQVSANSGSTVGSNRNEATGADRSTMVGGSNAEMIGGNESTTVGANQRVQVGGNQAVSVTGNRDLAVTGNQGHTVTGNRNADITGNDQLSVTGNRSVAVTGAQKTDYQATHEENVGASQKIVVGGEQTINVTGPQGLKSASSQKIEAPSQEIKADGVQALKSTNLTVDASADVTVTTPTFLVNGATIQLKGDQILIKGGQVTIEDGEIAIKGGKVTVNGSPIEMDGGGLVQVTAGLIKLN
ncbi:type VI secretion system Vgr family protein [Chondromyces apiculatus]|uniref:VgrG protein n=1 Tax=Chondromyces apiculatus DSM 436 TaxID=1192034 RepID=A0A017SZ45_9BACT|nr:type VI secretion system tip protein TssI/VgrG [Chondromyces apiculatus]EYF02269.1 VgrG protein [Chondromyces apiculatus DSM 436]